jgi:hypothetical protein
MNCRRKIVKKGEGLQVVFAFFSINDPLGFGGYPKYSANNGNKSKNVMKG